MRGLRCAALFVAVAALVAGCGGGDAWGDVSGTVSYDGTPVEDGAISFIPADGKGQGGGGTIKDGKYAAKVSVGNMKVQVSGSKVVSKKKVYNTPDSPVMPVTAEILPPRYSDREKTELTFEVAPGPSTKNWDLKK
ncbi:MAG: hypothetical protein ACKODX_17325 [Gemmata sp.]